MGEEKAEEDCPSLLEQQIEEKGEDEESGASDPEPEVPREVLPRKLKVEGEGEEGKSEDEQTGSRVKEGEGKTQSGRGNQRQVQGTLGIRELGNDERLP